MWLRVGWVQHALSTNPYRFCMSASTEVPPVPLLPLVKLPPLPVTPPGTGVSDRGERIARMDPACPKLPIDIPAAAAAFARLLLEALRDTCGEEPSSSGCICMPSVPASARHCCCSWLLLLLDPVSMPPLWSHGWPLRDNPLADGDGRDSGCPFKPPSCCCCWPPAAFKLLLLKAPGWRMPAGPAAPAACGDELPPTSSMR